MILTRYLHYEDQEAKAILIQNVEHDEQRTTTDQNLIISTHHQHRTDRIRAPLWHVDNFVSGYYVQTTLQYWKGTFLATYPQRDEFLGYIGGERLSESIDPVSAGIFEGFQFKEADATPIKLPNHVPTSHDWWVDIEI